MYVYTDVSLRPIVQRMLSAAFHLVFFFFLSFISTTTARPAVAVHFKFVSTRKHACAAVSHTYIIYTEYILPTLSKQAK